MCFLPETGRIVTGKPWKQWGTRKVLRRQTTTAFWAEMFIMTGFSDCEGEMWLPAIGSMIGENACSLWMNPGKTPFRILIERVCCSSRGSWNAVSPGERRNLYETVSGQIQMCSRSQESSMRQSSLWEMGGIISGENLFTLWETFRRTIW